MCVGGTGRRDAAGGRELRFSARGVRRGAMGADVFVFIYVADADSGSAGGGFGRDWIFAVPDFLGAADGVGAEMRFGIAGSGAGDSALPEDYGYREDFRAAVDGRDGHDGVGYFGGRDAFQQTACVHVSAGGVELVMGIFRGAGRGDGEYGLHVLGLLQHLPSGRGDTRSGEK